MSYKRTIEIKGPHENAVESFIHEVRKNADNAQRYGVNLQISRVEPESERTAGFDDE